MTAPVFRNAGALEVQSCYRVLSDAREKMWREGRDQWTADYPLPLDVKRDIDNGCAYVLDAGSGPVAYGAVIFTGEPAYAGITDGQWLSDLPFVVVHRLAVSPQWQGRGLAREFIRSVEKLAAERGFRSFRIDTREDNAAMIHLLLQSGFTKCGTVVLPVNKVRIGFEKLL